MDAPQPSLCPALCCGGGLPGQGWGLCFSGCGWIHGRPVWPLRVTLARPSMSSCSRCHHLPHTGSTVYPVGFLGDWGRAPSTHLLCEKHISGLTSSHLSSGLLEPTPTHALDGTHGEGDRPASSCGLATSLQPSPLQLRPGHLPITSPPVAGGASFPSAGLPQPWLSLPLRALLLRLRWHGTPPPSLQRSPQWLPQLPTLLPHQPSTCTGTGSPWLGSPPLAQASAG